MNAIIWLVGIALVVYALVDLITIDHSQVKHLPKVTWVFVILILPVLGSLIWLLAGKDKAPLTEGWGSFGDPNRHMDAAPKTTTEQELEALDREIAFHEKQDKIKRLEAELEKRRQGRPDAKS